MTRPGGRICFTTCEDTEGDNGHRRRMMALAPANGRELPDMYDADDLKCEGVGCKVCIYGVAS